MGKLLQNCKVDRSWHAAHFCNLNLTSISYSFWNKGRKVLKLWKFDKKGQSSKMGIVIYFKITRWVDLDILHIISI